MYFKIRKSDGRVIYLTLGPETFKKGHVPKDENGFIDEVKCFALCRRPKYKKCWLANAIGTSAKQKGRNLRK